MADNDVQYAYLGGECLLPHRRGDEGIGVCVTCRCDFRAYQGVWAFDVFRWNPGFMLLSLVAFWSASCRRFYKNNV